MCGGGGWSEIALQINVAAYHTTKAWHSIPAKIDIPPTLDFSPIQVHLTINGQTLCSSCGRNIFIPMLLFACAQLTYLPEIRNQHLQYPAHTSKC